MQAPAVDPKPQRGRRYAQSSMRAKRGKRLRHIALIAALACGCNLDNEGDEPPAKQLYFTNALALSVPAATGEAPRYLFAANSNYDLRYNAGSVVAIDLDKVAQRVEENRERRDGRDQRDEREDVIEPAEVIVDEAFIGAYSTALGMAPDLGEVASDGQGHGVRLDATTLQLSTRFMRRSGHRP